MHFSSTPMVVCPASRRVLLMPMAIAVAVAICPLLRAASLDTAWVAATDASLVRRNGEWAEARFRYAATSHLRTTAGGAALEYEFEGTGVAVRFGPHAVPAYGTPNSGVLTITVDGVDRTVLRPIALANEMIIARGLARGKHVLRIEHREEASPKPPVRDSGTAEEPTTDAKNTGCRIEAFLALKEAWGEAQFSVSGEENAFLVDVRAVLKKGGRLVRDTLVRNWLTGQCALVGLPPGDDYTLEITASGWQPASVRGFAIRSNETSHLAPIFLKREAAATVTKFAFPALNRPAIHATGETFRARFQGNDNTIKQVVLRRQVGPAVISRILFFEEDRAAAFMYDREIVARLGADVPQGLYDLTIVLDVQGRTQVCHSPRSVHVVRSQPSNPVLVTFGHLDTSGQYQAEYLERLAGMINLLAPDLVLVSNEVNPAYVSGALSRLEMPYLINFGNHQFPGHEKWYGDPVRLVDVGDKMCVLNFGHPWHVDRGQADLLLASRPNAVRKLINAFEDNAPVALLDRHRVAMIHDAHGGGGKLKVQDIGATPTRRVGKINATSFRVVRFENNRVVSCTYNGDKVAPIPFARDEQPPLRVSIRPADEALPLRSSRAGAVATLTNDYLDPFPQCRLTFVMPAGRYRADAGRIEDTIPSDDGRHVVVTVRVDAPARGSVRITLRPVSS